MLQAILCEDVSKYCMYIYYMYNRPSVIQPWNLEIEDDCSIKVF